MPLSRWFQGTVTFIIVAACPHLLAADKSVQALQKVLNSSDYNLVNPANNFIFAGGIVVSDQKHSSFYGLPATVTKPATDDVIASWPKSQINGSVSVQAILSGLAKLFGGSAKFSHSNQLTLDEIDASGKRIQDGLLDTLAANPVVASQIATWLKDPKNKYSVYFVNTVLATTNLSVSSSSGTNVAAAFQTTPPTCTTPTQPAATTTPATTTTPTTSTTANTATPTTTAPATPTTTTQTSGSSTTGNLQACVAVSNSSQLSLSTKTPLYFAATLNPVSLENGKVVLGPVVQLTKSGSMSPVSSSPPSSSKWKKVNWPTN
jgi:hypothetical protein